MTWMETRLKNLQQQFPDETEDQLRERIRNERRAAQANSRKTYSGKGGFYGNPEKARIAGRKGAESRWHKKES